MDYDKLFKQLVEGEQESPKEESKAPLNDFNSLLSETNKVYEAKKKCCICDGVEGDTKFTKDPTGEVCDSCWSDKAVDESINEALPDDLKKKKFPNDPNQPVNPSVENPADEGEPLPDETVNPETGEEEIEAPDDVSAEPDMNGPSGMGGGPSGEEGKEAAPAIDPTEVKATPSSGQEKENFGRKGSDEFFYMVTMYSPDGVKEDIQILNAVDEKLWSAKENGVEDMDDMKTIIRQAADKVEATNVDRGILDKYWFEAEDDENIEKANKEEQIQKETEQATKETEKPTSGQPTPRPGMGTMPVGEAKIEEAKVYQDKNGKWFYDAPDEDGKGIQKQGPFDTKKEAIDDRKVFLQENKGDVMTKKINESIQIGAEVIYNGTGAKGYTGKKAKVVAVSPEGDMTIIQFEDGAIYKGARVKNLAPVSPAAPVDPKIDALKKERANPKPMDAKGEDEVFDLQKQYALNPKTRESKVNEEDMNKPDAKVEKPGEVKANQKITGDKEEGNTPSANSILGKIDTDGGCKEVKPENEEGASTPAPVSDAPASTEIPGTDEETPEEVKPEADNETEEIDTKKEEVVEEGKVPVDPAHITDPEKTVQELKEEAIINKFFDLFNGKVVENKSSISEFNGILNETKEVK